MTSGGGWSTLSNVNSNPTEAGKMNDKHVLRLAGAFLASGLLLGACGGDDDNSLTVELSEWAVTVDGSADAGEISITADNVGGEPHELVIIKGLNPDDLAEYLDETGFVVEDRLPEGAFIGEIEEFAAGTEETQTFDLEAGDYTFFCNIVEQEEDGEWESHYLEGMAVAVTIG